jgi:hypothetical protein
MGLRHGAQLESVGTSVPSRYGLNAMPCVGRLVARNLAQPALHVDELRVGIALVAEDTECPRPSSNPLTHFAGVAPSPSGG